MNSKPFPILLIWLSVGLGVVGCAGGSSSVDLGDQSTGNPLWGAVHYTFEDKDLDKALEYADTALELYGAEARKEQASLSGFSPTDPPEATYKYRTLNNIGMVALVRGEILLRQGDRAGAKESYSMVIDDFGYAQARDLGEWREAATSVPKDAHGFLKLAEVAKLELAEIAAGMD